MPGMVKATARKATRSDVHRLGRTLARAFQDDVAMFWAIPDAASASGLGPNSSN
jgi:hypothetical protein